MGDSLPVLYVVVPCFNEEAVLPITMPKFWNQLEEMINDRLVSGNSKILYVNDGSMDSTWEIIREKSKENEHFLGISLSRNFGHQNALLAGLLECRNLCDITISIDCDGQDDIGVMSEMVKKYVGGYEIVYGVRNNRDTDSFFKRITAQVYYRFLEVLGAEVVYNHADYRLLSARVLNELADFGEVNLYLRGLVPLLGFNSTTVEYKRMERESGKTHYPMSKMLALACNGIANASVQPLRMITRIGVAVALMSFIGVVWAVVEMLNGNTISGWASMTCIICFVSGIQLISTGIMGEYIGKTYMEAKRRPRYIISETVGGIKEKE